MLPDLIHLSREDMLSLDIAPGVLRQAMADVFTDVAEGTCSFLPKSQLAIAPGHSFQAMVAASSRWSKAMVKWVGVVPPQPGSPLPGISAVISLNDLATGHPLALLDGEVVTLQRTAALSALAASKLVGAPPKILGLAGCGLQARSHLVAMKSLFPSLQMALCFSKSAASAEGLAQFAVEHGMTAQVVTTADALLSSSDLVISMIPAAPGLVPMLDARVMKPDATAIMVDLGRSWISESLPSFAQIATDSLEQMRHPLNAQGDYVTDIEIRADLVTGFSTIPGRQAFCYKGHAAADLAAAILMYKIARDQKLGTRLRR